MEFRTIAYDITFHYSQFYFVTIAAVLGTGVLGLPITLYDSGFGPFIISICIAYFVQVLLILFFTEVLQKVYYHNIEKLKESEQDHMLIQVDTEESPTSESNYDVIADRGKNQWDVCMCVVSCASN